MAEERQGEALQVSSGVGIGRYMPSQEDLEIISLGMAQTRAGAQPPEPPLILITVQYFAFDFVHNTAGIGVKMKIL